MVINGIETADISFVVQGAIDSENTPLCLKSIRTYFPESEIVLSTWKKSAVNGLNFDKVVFSDDPGAAICDLFTVNNNINRQLLSTKAGLEKATRKYIAKVRSDLIFDGPDFLTYFNNFPKYNSVYKRAKSKMIILSMYTRLMYIDYDEYTVNPSPLHISDWFLFGYAEDVKEYYSAPMIEDIGAFSRFYLDQPEKYKSLPYRHLMIQLTPEQYFASRYFQEYKYDTIIKIQDFNFEDYLKLLVNNFIVLDYEHSRIFSGKWADRSKNEWIMHPFEVGTLVFYADFLKYYKRYCDSEFHVENQIDRKVYQRKLKIFKEVLWRNKIEESLKKKLNSIQKILKGVMRKVFPAYRVANSTRQELLALRSEESDRFGFLVYRINQLEEKVRKSRNEIIRLKKRLEQYNGTDTTNDG